MATLLPTLWRVCDCVVGASVQSHPRVQGVDKGNVLAGGCGTPCRCTARAACDSTMHAVMTAHSCAACAMMRLCACGCSARNTLHAAPACVLHLVSTILLAGLCGGSGIVPGGNIGTDVAVFEQGARHVSKALAGAASHMNWLPWGICHVQCSTGLCVINLLQTYLYVLVHVKVYCVYGICSIPKHTDASVCLIVPNADTWQCICCGHVQDSPPPTHTLSLSLFPRIATTWTHLNLLHTYMHTCINAGKGIANPTALMLSTSMMLRHLQLHSFSDR